MEKPGSPVDVLFGPDWTDGSGLTALHDAAFGGPDEGRIVEALKDEAVLSYIAMRKGGVIGHVLFSKLQNMPGLGLGPMAVHPDYQRQGIGTTMLSGALKLLKDHPFIVVLGHPEYYPRFGFQPSKNLRCRYTDGDAFMVLDLGGLEGVEGMVEYHPAFR